MGQERKGQSAFDQAAQTIEMSALQKEARRGEGIWVVMISFVALVFSALSLYETVVKQAQLRIYLPDVMYYARDPNTSEVFALPLTIANHGARDGSVTRLRLILSDPGTGQERVYAATFSGDNPSREKHPFAPLVISGRNAWQGTLLFYPMPGGTAAASGPAINSLGSFRFRLSADAGMTNDYGFLDQIFWSPPQEWRFTASLVYWSLKDVTDRHETLPMNLADMEAAKSGGGTGRP